MKSKQHILYLFLVMLIGIQSLNVQAAACLPHGFREIRKEKYGQDLWHTYVHAKSGLEVVWIENKDPDKAFVLGVKTPVTDDTGVNHIIEHTLFTGSEKYPSSSLFFDASEAYPGSYMNALTTGDMTIFPFATPYDTCYEALLDIYLDAVFRPGLLKNPYGFYEESFHYVPQEKRTGGVVYNEMKGAYDSTERAIYRQLRKMIFAGSHYAYDSGGNPDKIPALTYKACRRTYLKYYYPGNMKIVLYGSLPIEKTLKVISGYVQDVKNPHKSLNLGVDQTSSVHTAEYEVLPEKEKGCVVKAFVLNDKMTAAQMQDLDLWLETYFMGPQSCLQAGLNASGLQVKMMKDDGTAHPVYALVVTDLPCKDMEKCAALIDQLLEKMPETITRNLFLERDILNENRWYMEKQEENVNRGINIAEHILDGWAHGREEDQYFIRTEHLRKMKQINMETGRHFLENAQRYTLFLKPGGQPHQNPVTLSPLNEKAWQKIQVQMKKWQSARYPLAPVALDQLVIGMQKAPVIQKKSDYWTMETRIDTRLARSQIYLNTSHIPEDKLNYLFLYSHLLEESAKDITPFSGTITTSCGAYPLKEGYWPCFRLTVTTLKEEEQHGTLFGEARMGLLNRSENWYQQKLGEWTASMRAASRNNAIGTLAGLTVAGEDERTAYLYKKNYPLYCFCRQLLQQRDTKWIDEVKKIDESLYRKGGLILSTTIPEKQCNRYEKSWEKEIAGFKKAPNLKGSYSQNVPSGSVAVVAETAVDYCFKSLYKPEGITGEDYLLAACLTKNYLYPKLRVEEGAYGAGCQVYDMKTMGLYVYRTPDYKRALRLLEQSGSFLKELTDGTRLERSKAEALSRVHQQFGMLGTPMEKAAVNENLILWGKAPSDLMKLQMEILEVQPQQLSQKKTIFEKMLKSGKTGIMTKKDYTKGQNFTIYEF